MLRVRFLVWEETEDEQGEIGSFVLRNRKVEIEPVTPEGMFYLTRILSRPLRTDKTGLKRIYVNEDPERWMRLLPLNYDGAMERAELEEA